jgi:hypothetical protein
MSPVLGTVSVAASVTSVRQVRVRLEVCVDMGMLRRSTLYQELLFLMGHCPNHFQRPSRELRQYRVGAVRRVGNALAAMASQSPLRERRSTSSSQWRTRTRCR